MSATTGGSGPDQKTGTTHAAALTVALLSSLVGLADAIYILREHIARRAGHQLAGLCDLSVTLNCSAAMDSAYSQIAGVPIAVFAISFWVGTLVLFTRYRRASDQAAVDLWILGLSLAAVYSGVLLVIMLSWDNAVCPACLVNDLVIAVALVALVWGTKGGLGGALRRVLRAPADTLVGVSGLLSLGAGGVAFVATLWIMNAQDGGAEEALIVEPEYVFGELVLDYPTRYHIDGVEDAPEKGPSDAPILLVEFSDFECPYCFRFSQTIEAAHQAYPDQVRVRFMHYPLCDSCNPHMTGCMHEYACVAASAAVCADAQGKFWEMHDLMFLNQRHLDRESLLQMADSLELDRRAFRRCLDAESTAETIVDDANAGYAAMVDQAGMDSVGTPFFFVNGLGLRGNMPLEVLEIVIDSELGGTAEAGDGTANED